MPNTMTPSLAPARCRELEKFGERIARFGVNFAVVTTDGRVSVLVSAGRFESDPEQLAQAGRCVLDRVEELRCEGSEIPVWQFADGHVLVASPLLMPLVIAGYRHPAGAAIIDLGDSPTLPSDAGRNIEYLSEMLRLIAVNHQTTMRTEEQIDTVGVELARVYEELVLLHKISTNMRVTESDTNFLQLACDSLTDIILVEGIAVLLERIVEGEKRFVVAAGSGLIDIDDALAILSLIHI